MRNIIEYTLISLDGVCAGSAISSFAKFRDDEAYTQDGLDQALACGALLMGRTTYEDFVKIWPMRTDPWANRINAMPKYVFSSKLEKADWNNTTIVQGDVVAEVTKLKQQEGQDLLIYGSGLLTETLLKHQLLNTFDLVVFPLVLGQGKQLFHEGETADLKFIATKNFSKGLVKLTYAPQY